MKQVLFLLLVIVTVPCASQQQRIGYINSDSLLHTIPDYDTAYNILVARRKFMSDQLSGMQIDLERRKHEYDSLKATSSPLLNSLQERDIQEFEENISAFQHLAKEELKPDSLRLLAFHYVLLSAISDEVWNTKCQNYCETKYMQNFPDRESVEWVDLNGRVGANLRSSPIVNARPKRIGYVNKDSILDLFPEYKMNRLTAVQEMRVVGDSAVRFQTTYFRMVVEYDSLKATSTPMENEQRKAEIDTFRAHATTYYTHEVSGIMRRDSIRNRMYRMNLETAILVAGRKTNCFYVYDTKDVHTVWWVLHPEFVSVNKEVAQELRL